VLRDRWTVEGTLRVEGKAILLMKEMNCYGGIMNDATFVRMDSLTIMSTYGD
jgi:hypothetical protein